MNDKLANEQLKRRLNVLRNWNPLSRPYTVTKPEVSPNKEQDNVSAPKVDTSSPEKTVVQPATPVEQEQQTSPPPPVFSSPLTSTQTGTSDFNYSEQNSKFPSIKIDENGKAVEVKKIKGKIKEFPISIVTKLEDLKNIIMDIYRSGRVCTIQFKKAGSGFQEERPINGSFIPATKDIVRKDNSPFEADSGKGEKFLFGDQALYNKIRMEITRKKQKAGIEMTPEVKIQTEQEARKEAGLRSGFLYAIQYINGGGKVYVVDLDSSLGGYHTKGARMSKVPYISYMLQKARDGSQVYIGGPKEGGRVVSQENNSQTQSTTEPSPMKNADVLFNNSIQKLAAEEAVAQPQPTPLAAPQATPQADVPSAPVVPVSFDDMSRRFGELKDALLMAVGANPYNKEIQRALRIAQIISREMPTVYSQLKKAALL